MCDAYISDICYWFAANFKFFYGYCLCHRFTVGNHCQLVDAVFMVAIGSKALPLRRHRTGNFVGDSIMGEDDLSYKQSNRKKGMNRKGNRESHGFDGDNSKRNASGRRNDGSVEARNTSMHQNTPVSQTTFVRYYSLFYNYVCFVCAVLRMVADVRIV